MPATSYDAIPYASLPLPHTHPNRMAAIGHLLGMEAVDPRRGRVLEIGCGSGGNLAAMAATLPEAQFLGFDLSQRQIDDGVRVAGEAGLQNVTLQCADLGEVTAGELGRFDYVIAHGVFSWVSERLQDKLLALCAAVMTDRAIAYVSYNTYPGWHARGMARDLMRYHALQFEQPDQQALQARAVLDFAARYATAGDVYKAEQALLEAQPDYYVLHEQLAAENNPLYFHQFVARARAHGLEYLSETELNGTLPDGFPREAQEMLGQVAADVVQQEQFMDFLRNRMFRQTLLVKQAVPVRRQVDPGRVRKLSFSGAVKSTGPMSRLEAEPETFVSVTGASVTTTNPLTRAALHRIAGAYPGGIRYTELLADAYASLRPWAPRTPSAQEEAVLTADLLRCALLGLLDVYLHPLPCVSRPGARPCASALARLQAGSGGNIASLRHETLDLSAPGRALLAMLDGTRDRARLLSALPELGSAEALDQMLNELAAVGLLSA